MSHVSTISWEALGIAVVISSLVSAEPPMFLGYHVCSNPSACTALCPSLITCCKVPICSWVCMLAPEVYHPSTWTLPCFGLAIISAPAYRNLIDAIGSYNGLKDLAEVSCLFFPWSLYQIRSSWHFPVSDLYFWSTSEQSIPQVISGSFCELRADFLHFLFNYM